MRTTINIDEDLLSSIGAFVLAAGVLLFIVDAIRTWRRPRQHHHNPWQAGTLEWRPSARCSRGSPAC